MERPDWVERVLGLAQRMILPTGEALYVAVAEVSKGGAQAIYGSFVGVRPDRRSDGTWPTRMSVAVEKILELARSGRDDGITLSPVPGRSTGNMGGLRWDDRAFAVSGMKERQDVLIAAILAWSTHHSMVLHDFVRWYPTDMVAHEVAHASRLPFERMGLSSRRYRTLENEPIRLVWGVNPNEEMAQVTEWMIRSYNAREMVSFLGRCVRVLPELSADGGIVRVEDLQVHVYDMCLALQDIDTE